MPVLPQNDPAPHAVRHESGLWEGEHGTLGPVKPGRGPRNDPVGEFPTGPDVGTLFPALAARAHDGRLVDVHQDRAGRPAAVVFYRSAVW